MDKYCTLLNIKTAIKEIDRKNYEEIKFYVRFIPLPLIFIHYIAVNGINEATLEPIRDIFLYVKNQIMNDY